MKNACSWFCLESQIAEIKLADTTEASGGSNYVVRMMGALNDKSSALLTHISMLVAALAFLTTYGQMATVKLYIGIEMALYLLIALPCLFAIQVSDKIPGLVAARKAEKGTDLTPEVKRFLEDEIATSLATSYASRRRAYSVAWFFTMIITFVTVLTLGWGVWTDHKMQQTPPPTCDAKCNSR